MVITDNLIALLSSEPRLKVLRCLWKTQIALTVRQIADHTRLPLFSVQRALTAFDGTRILHVKQLGRSHQISLNPEHYVVVDLLPRLFLDRLDECLQKLITATNKNALSITLFGSHARKQAKAGSDIDLFFVTSDKQKLEKKLNPLIDQLEPYYATHISPYIQTPLEWRDAVKHKRSTETNILRDGKLLWGKPLREFL